MKANAPEKIYLSSKQRTDKEIFYVFATPVENDDIEYIRTDAFIEKACAWLKENKDKYLYNTGEKGDYIPTCSGKMIKDFEEYLKK